MKMRNKTFTPLCVKTLIAFYTFLWERSIDIGATMYD